MPNGKGVVQDRVPLTPVQIQNAEKESESSLNAGFVVSDNYCGELATNAISGAVSELKTEAVVDEEIVVPASNPAPMKMDPIKIDDNQSKTDKKQTSMWAKFFSCNCIPKSLRNDRAKMGSNLESIEVNTQKNDGVSLKLG